MTVEKLKGLKVFWALAVFAFVVLSAAAVWMGGLNQDEGWYLYAANLVAEGRKPYADFAYTQGPLLPIVYSAVTGVWKTWGLLGARIFNLTLGLVGILFAVATARALVPAEKKSEAGLVAFLLLGCNLYHLYYLAIPKTYALAAHFIGIGFFLLAIALRTDGPRIRFRKTVFFVAGVALAFAAGARISLGAILAVVGFALLFAHRRLGAAYLWFGLGGLTGLLAAYGPFVLDPAALTGLIEAQKYHAARGGFDLTFTVGSLSRLVRWYLPLFLVLGLGSFRRAVLWLVAFAGVFAVQMLAPFPYEDYQVPVMGLLAVYAAVNFADAPLVPGRPAFKPLLVLGVAFASAFGSPLLEKWTINGQDRFWCLKKPQSELAQLREVAQIVEAFDPGGKELLTQDLYLAIETNRKVPEGLEMGPFSVLSDEAWRHLLKTCDVPVAALSGYAFSINPPVCDERPIESQMAFWNILKERYSFVYREEAFGQNATPLLILKKK